MRLKGKLLHLSHCGYSCVMVSTKMEGKQDANMAFGEIDGPLVSFGEVPI